MAEKKYKILARGSFGIRHCRLYRTDDHLLQVSGTYIEEYRKFYFREIKGALIQRHKVKNRVAAVTLGSLTLLSILLLNFSDPVAWGFGVFCSAITLILLLYFLPALLTGGFASLYLVTAVQHGRITAVSSFRKARKVVRFIESQLELEQPERSPQAVAPL